MKAGNLVRVVHHDPQGPYPVTPVWDAVTMKFMGRARHGEVFLVVRTNLRKCGLGPASAGWTGDAEIIHPAWGGVLIEQAYLEVINDPA